MGIGPLLSGRLPGSLATNQLMSNIQNANQIINNYQQRVATGQDYFLPSESPASAVRAIGLQKLLERNSQVQQNVQSDLTFLEVSESNLTTINDALNKAKSLVVAGIGSTYSATEKQAMATELDTYITGAIFAANATYNGRYLFGGSNTDEPPFTLDGDGSVIYNGDDFQIQSYTDLDQLLANNVSGASAFQALSTPISSDIDPALSKETKIEDLLNGRGVALGQIQITIDDSVAPQTETIDLSQAKTVGDLETLIEDVFAGGPLTLDVEIDPGSLNGLSITPSAGTVEIENLAGTTVARDLGIETGPVAVVNGEDLNPALTLNTKISELNGGAGIGALTGTGLQITLGAETATVDLEGAETIEDVFNRILETGLDVDVHLNENQNGINLVSRKSGAPFGIGENGGTNAAGLGIRTFTGETLLQDLNGGVGVNVDGEIPLEITRRDGSQVPIDLSGTKTVQDVLDAINAVDPGNLVASLSSVGNGISITDNSGTGPLTIEENTVSVGLGLNGSETGNDNTVALVGSDSNPQDTNGVFAILTGIKAALETGDDVELNRLGGLLDTEIERFTVVRGEVGSRLQSLTAIESRLADKEVQLQEALSSEIDTDIAEVFTQVTYMQTVLQATMQLAASMNQLSLFQLL